MIIIIIVIAVGVLASLLIYFYIFRGLAINGQATNGDDVSMLELAEEADRISPAIGVTEITEEEIAAVAGEYVGTISEAEAAEYLGSIHQIAPADAIGLNLTPELDRIQYYNMRDLAFVSVNFAGQDATIIKSSGSEIDEILWAPDRHHLVFKTSDNQNFYSDVNSDTEISLQSDIRSSVFTDDSNRIAYYIIDPESFANVVLQNPMQVAVDLPVIERIRGNVTIRNIPGQNKLAVYLVPNISRQAGIYSIKFDGTDRQLVIGNEYALDASWSPDGRHMIYTVMGKNERPVLWLANGDGSNRRELPLQTYIDKVVWSGTENVIFVAVPKLLPKITDYYSGSATTSDRIYKINLNTLEARLLMDLSTPTTDFDVRDILLSPEEKLLYFQSKNDSGIYVINLEKTYRLLEPRL